MIQETCHFIVSGGLEKHFGLPYLPQAIADHHRHAPGELRRFLQIVCHEDGCGGPGHTVRGGVDGPAFRGGGRGLRPEVARR